jgi:UDP-N-acetylmuramate dehydrogenase
MLIKTGDNLIKAVTDLRISAIIRPDEELKNHTTLRIGGPAEVFIHPETLEDLRKIVVLARENNFALFILGGGSKVLVPDTGLEGITVKLDTPYFKKINFRDKYLSLGAGLKVHEFLKVMSEKGIGGWEFLAGIPASIAGILVLNAGVRKDSAKSGYLQVGDSVEEVTVMDRNGKVFTLDKDILKFDYRKSNLNDFIVLETRLSAAIKTNREEIQAKTERFLGYRRQTQELTFPSAGCVFKNPAEGNRSSGELIELSGFKGKRIGDVLVSPKHANFILNVGEGKASDFLSLMDLIQRKVKQDHGVWLESEIRVL